MILVDLISSSMAFNNPEEALLWPPRLPVYLTQGNDGKVNEIMRHSRKITAFWWIMALKQAHPIFKTPLCLLNKMNYNLNENVTLLKSIWIWKLPFTLSYFQTARKLEKKQVKRYFFILVSSEAKDLILWMLNVNPLKRPSLRQILRHPWMTMKGITWL